MTRLSSLSLTKTTMSTDGLPAWGKDCLISLLIAVCLAILTLGAGIVFRTQGLGWLAVGPLVVSIGWGLAWGFVLVRHLHRSLTGALGFWLFQGTLWHGSYRDGPMSELETALMVTWALALIGLAIALISPWIQQTLRYQGRRSQGTATAFSPIT